MLAAGNNGDLLSLYTFILTLIVTVGAVGAGVYVISKTRGTSGSVNIMATTNAELRDANDDLRKEITDQATNFDLKLFEQDARCAREMAKLQGQIDVLTSDMGRQIATAVMTAIREDRNE